MWRWRDEIRFKVFNVPKNVQVILYIVICDVKSWRFIVIVKWSRCMIGAWFGRRIKNAELFDGFSDILLRNLSLLVLFNTKAAVHVLKLLKNF